MDVNKNAAEMAGISEDGKKIYRWKTVLKVLATVLALILILALLLYGAADIALHSKSFPITLVGDDGEGGLRISLSEDAAGTVLSTHLKAPVIDEMGDMSSLYLPADVDSGEGSHNGTDYIAYTFYLRNPTDKVGKVEERMDLLAATKGADEAVRIRIFRDGVPATYAAPAKDGGPEYGTTPFADNKTIYTDTADIAAGQVVRYTIVIWLEGDDPECVDSVRGGKIRVSVNFAVKDE